MLRTFRKALLRWYRWRLRKAYQRLNSLLGEFSCGSNLARYVSGRVVKREAKCVRLFNKCMALQKLIRGRQ